MTMLAHRWKEAMQKHLGAQQKQPVVETVRMPLETQEREAPTVRRS